MTGGPAHLIYLASDEQVVGRDGTYAACSADLLA
jgi:hypothetical protein